MIWIDHNLDVQHPHLSALRLQEAHLLEKSCYCLNGFGWWAHLVFYIRECAANPVAIHQKPWHRVSFGFVHFVTKAGIEAEY